jgi:superfamily I DNA/RNA helicase
MNLDSKYSPEERWRAIAEYDGGMLVCLAGPGTGKTHSLVSRVQHLTESRRVSADSLYYITFIREIARTFTDDLVSFYTDQGKTAPPVWASTLHSLACRLIRNRGPAVGVEGEQYFLNLAERDNWMANAALTDLLALLDDDPSPTVAQLRARFESAKEAWRAGNYAALSGDPTGSLVGAYTRLSRAYRVLDWDEVIPLAARILDARRDMPTWLQRYDHLLIDEYQDFNPAEQRLLDRLTHRAQSTVMVGDDDQSLYRGRGADPSGIRSVWDDASLDQVSLVLCHRCPSAITQAANNFLGRVKQNPRVLLPTRNGGAVVIRPFKSAKAEVEFLAAHLSGCLASLAPPWDAKQGVACLFPTRDVLRQYQRALAEAGVPCQVRGALASRQSEDWLRLMLRLACQPRQPFLERILLERFNEIKGHHKKLLAATVTSQNIGTGEAVRVLVEQRRWRGSAADDADRYLRSLDNLESRDARRIAEEIHATFPAELVCDASTIDRLLQTAVEENLEDAIDVAVTTLLGSEQQEGPRSRVELFTMHGSKGLTRRYIALPGLEHCWLPGEASGERLEELQRLFYVAITRSSDGLLITYPRTRARGDSLNYPRSGRGELSAFAACLGVAVTRP